MNFMNGVLIVLGLVVLGFTLYLNKVDNIPPVLSNLSGLMGVGYLLGGLLVVFGIIGICASYGGCLLYLYSILITILSIICVVATIAIIVVTVGMKLKESGNSTIIDKVDNFTMSYVTNEANAESWKNMQNALKCCGYTGMVETGDLCTPTEPDTEKGPDCREFIFEQLESKGTGSESKASSASGESTGPSASWRRASWWQQSPCRTPPPPSRRTTST